ncbi:lipopolysaccharide biosynthesis protein [Methylomonas sp. EFPC3]|uniref:lipopolysaccharide biosynthesis protein n=1 Tax=Methylomonas sp. EFPC3 TaxID=3021710 RepID=UPI0024168EB1|nr:lipopolysaccharide biosynthesis protein [Methylomonas sp. EFPC3]WFP51673.1 lipopolysaccharide biosynthesis protein [Methylomonas sp. EFPC3]
MQNIESKGIKAFFWDFSGKTIRQIIGFITSIILTRTLEPTDFGIMALVMVIIGITSIFSDFGLSSALIQKRKILQIHYSSVFYFNLATGFILTFITFLSADWIGFFYENEKLAPVIRTISPSFVLNAFGSVSIIKLRKELSFALLTKYSLLTTLMSGFLGIILALNNAGIWSLAAQALSMSLIYNIIIWKVAKWRPIWSFSWKALAQLWSFGFRMFLSAILSSILERVDILAIGKLVTSTTLGYFERAKSLNTILIQYSSGSLIDTLFPTLSTIQNNLPRLQKVIIKTIGITSFISFLITGNLYLTSDEIIIILFSEKWSSSSEFFKLFILTGYSYPINAVLVSTLSCRGNSKSFLRLEVYKAMITSINIIALYISGVKAYLYCMIVSTFPMLLLNILFATKEIEISYIRIAKPIIVQMLISTISLAISIFSSNIFSEQFPHFFALESLIFTVFYMLANNLIKTDGYIYSKELILLTLKIHANEK